MRRVAPNRRKFLLLLSSLLFSLALVEVALRVHYVITSSGELADLPEEVEHPKANSNLGLGDIIRLSEYPKLVYQLKPGLDVRFKGARVVTNALGWREAEVPEAKPPGTVRIIGIGDSVMFGWGVREKQRYMDLLEHELNRRFPSLRWEVLVFAVPGYNLVMQVEVLRRFALGYDPDLIVYGFVSNDFCLPNFISTRRSFFFLGSFLYERLRDSNIGIPALTVRERVLHNESGPDHDFFQTYCTTENVEDRYHSLVGTDRFLEALGQLAEIGRQHDLSVLLLSHLQQESFQVRYPDLPLPQSITYTDAVADVGRHLEREGIADMRHSDLVLSRKNPHPSARGTNSLLKFCCAS